MFEQRLVEKIAYRVRSRTSFVCSRHRKQSHDTNCCTCGFAAVFNYSARIRRTKLTGESRRSFFAHLIAFRLHLRAVFLTAIRKPRAVYRATVHRADPPSDGMKLVFLREAVNRSVYVCALEANESRAESFEASAWKPKHDL